MRCSTKEYPKRSIRLIDAVLSTWGKGDLLSEKRGRSSSRFEKWTQNDLQGLIVAAKDNSSLVWDLLVPHLKRLGAADDENDDFLDLWHDRMRNAGCEFIKSILDIAIEVGKVLAQQNGPSFFHRTGDLRGDPSLIIQFLLVECYPSETAGLVGCPECTDGFWPIHESTAEEISRIPVGLKSRESVS